MKRNNKSNEIEDIIKSIRGIDLESYYNLDTLDIVSKYFYLIELFTCSTSINSKELKFIYKYYMKENYVYFTFKSKQKNILKYSDNFKISEENENFIEILKIHTIKILKLIFTSELAYNYIEELNCDIVRITNGLECSMSFQLSDNTIVDISDNIVVFGVNVESALRIPDLALYQYINKFLYEEKLKTQLEICQTSLQILKYENILLDDLGIIRNSRPDLLLRATFFRNYNNMKSSGVGYIIDIDNDIIALIENINGKEKIKLSPVSIKNYMFKEHNIMKKEI